MANFYVRDVGQHEFEKRIRELMKKADVTIGVHAEEGAQAKKEFAEHAIGPVKQEKAENKAKGESENVTLIDVASAHEFGIGTVPRPFIGGWVDESESKANEALARTMAEAASGKRTVEQAAQRFGVWAVGQIQKRIADGIDPPLTEATKERKRELSGQSKDTPLILTGQLRSSIKSRVKVHT